MLDISKRAMRELDNYKTMSSHYDIKSDYYYAEDDIKDSMFIELHNEYGVFNKQTE